MRKHLYLSLKQLATLPVFKQQLKRLTYRVETAGPVVATATAATTMCVKAPDYQKGMPVRAKLQFEGFDNATQTLKPHWASVRVSLLFPTNIKFTAEISENEISFLDTVVFKGERFIKKIYPRYQNSLQPDGNLSVHPFYLVPPSGGKRRLYNIKAKQ